MVVTDSYGDQEYDEMLLAAFEVKVEIVEYMPSNVSYSKLVCFKLSKYGYLPLNKSGHLLSTFDFFVPCTL